MCAALCLYLSTKGSHVQYIKPLALYNSISMLHWISLFYLPIVCYILLFHQNSAAIIFFLMLTELAVFLFHAVLCRKDSKVLRVLNSTGLSSKPLHRKIFFSFAFSLMINFEHIVI
jgi:hypothetical protein